MRRVPAALVVALLAACGERATPDEAPAVALNGAFVLPLARAVDPLSLTPDALTVTDERGRPLAARTRAEGRRLVVRLVVDEALLDDPPASVRVATRAGPALVGLVASDGGAMPPVEETFAVRPRLEDAPGGGLRLAAWGSRAAGGVARFSPIGRDGVLDPAVVVSDGEDVVLRFEGVIDPRHAHAGDAPLFPLRGEAELPAVTPPLDWTIVGTTSEVVLGLEGLEPPLRLRTRRLGLRSLAGAEPEPRLELLVRAAERD